MQKCEFTVFKTYICCRKAHFEASVHPTGHVNYSSFFCCSFYFPYVLFFASAADAGLEFSSGLMCPRGCNQSERCSAYLHWKQLVQRAVLFGDKTFNIQIRNAGGKVGVKLEIQACSPPPLFPWQHKPKSAGNKVPRMTFCLMPDGIRAKSRDVRFTGNDSLPDSRRRNPTAAAWPG